MFQCTNFLGGYILNRDTRGLSGRGKRSAARGVRSFENYRIRILFFIGRLDLAPLESVRRLKKDHASDKNVYSRKKFALS